MAPRFSDLTGGEAPSAAGKTSEAIDGLGTAATKLAEFFKTGVGDSVTALKKQLAKNIKDIDRARKRGIISEKQAATQVKGLNSALERVNKTAEEMTKGNISGAKAVKEMSDEVARSTKLLKAEEKVTKELLKGEKSRLTSMKMAAKRAAESLRFETKASRINTGESKIVKGGGHALNAVASKLPGSQGFGPSGFGGGAIDKLTEAGPWGMVMGAIAKIGMAVENSRRDAVIAATRRIISYGTETASITEDTKKWQLALSAASSAATDYKLDLEAVKSATISISSETGATAGEMTKVIPEIARLAFVQGRGIEDLSQQIAARANMTGKSVTDVTKELADTTNMAFELRKTLGGKTQIDVTDFSKDVQELSESMDSLNVDQRNLSKTFASALVYANKLGLSYFRGAKAAKELSKALTVGYDPAFATLNVEDNLDALSKSQDKATAEQAKKLQSYVASGFMTLQDAAESIREQGLDTKKEVTDARMKLLTEAINRGDPYQLIKAQFTGLTTDSMQLAQKIAEVQKDTGLGFEDALKKLSPEDQKAMAAQQKELAQRQIDPMDAMRAMTDKILYQLSTVLPDMLGQILKTLDAIGKLLDMLKNPADVAANTWSGIKDSISGLVSGDKADAADSLAALVSKKIEGVNIAGMSQKEIIQLPQAKGILQSMKSISAEQKGALVDILGEKEGGAISDYIEKGKASRDASAKRAADAAAAAAPAAPTPTGVTVKNGKPDAAGSVNGEVMLNYSQPGAARLNEKLANSNAAAAAAASNVKTAQ